jgi:hypothetical protein
MTVEKIAIEKLMFIDKMTEDKMSVNENVYKQNDCG